MTFSERLALNRMSWPLSLGLLAFAIVVATVVHRLEHGGWPDLEFLVLFPASWIAGFVLYRLWFRRQRTRNRPST